MDGCRLFRKASQGDEKGVSPSLSVLMTSWMYGAPPGDG